jgi:hypothetical protein
LTPGELTSCLKIELTTTMLKYSDWTNTRQLGAICDPTLDFESRILQSALAAWRGEAGSEGIPARSSLTARVLKHILGNVTIFERLEETPSRYRVRLMGTRITAVLGDMQGKTLDEVLQADALARWIAVLDATLTDQRPLRFLSHVAFKELDFLQGEILLAPLLDERGQPSMVFAATVFKSGVALGSELDTLLATSSGEHAQ